MSEQLNKCEKCGLLYVKGLKADEEQHAEQCSKDWLIHHGHQGRHIKVSFDTDYLKFFCGACQKDVLLINKIILCRCGRLIFNVHCPTCGFLDAIKMYSGGRSYRPEDIAFLINHRSTIVCTENERDRAEGNE